MRALTHLRRAAGLHPDLGRQRGRLPYDPGMGAWAEGAFDNDDAADWAAQFDGADQEEGLRLIEDALRQAAQTPPGQLRASPAQGQSSPHYGTKRARRGARQ